MNFNKISNISIYLKNPTNRGCHITSSRDYSNKNLQSVLSSAEIATEALNVIFAAPHLLHSEICILSHVKLSSRATQFSGNHPGMRR